MAQILGEALENQIIVDRAIRAIRSSLQIVIDYDATLDEIEHRWQLGVSIAQHSKLFLEGRINGADFLDLAETTGIRIDQYAEEVEQNLEHIGFL